MNNFRASIQLGHEVHVSPLVAEKHKRGKNAGDGLAAIRTQRNETRSVDERGDDRHRLPAEQATVRHAGQLHSIDLINLSGGGAMICGTVAPKMWDRVDLMLGDNGEIECAVRWIRGDRIGLEFAHETRIDCPAETRDALLREVILRSFPDLAMELPATVGTAAEPLPAEAADPLDPAHRRGAVRHPLIWSGLIHFDHESSIARLRNISETGALVESTRAFPERAELLLDLGDAGTMFATVGWVRGDQLGLVFKAPFDILALARSKPELAPQRWACPDYLRDEQSDSSPWAAQWGRLTIEEVQRTLSG